MPSRNVVKKYAPQSYYHLYVRGVNKQPIFNTEDDYTVFISLFKRYLSDKQSKNSSRHIYPSYKDRLQLLSYSLLSNHIHMLIYQKDERAIIDFMRSVMTSYSMYFNKTNNRVGPILQGRYRASLITDQTYLEHISRYIHLNPKNWKTSQQTSLGYYLGKRSAEWIKPQIIMRLFDNDNMKYIAFLEDYEDQKQIIDDLKWELADS